MAKVQSKNQALLTPDADLDLDLDAEIEALISGSATQKSPAKSPETRAAKSTIEKAPAKPSVAKPSVAEPSVAEDLVKETGNLKIKFVNKENPHKEGSKKAAQFELLRGSKRVSDFLSAGGKAKHLNRWMKEGHLEFLD